MNHRSRFVRIVASMMAMVLIFLCVPVASSATAINTTTQITYTRDFIVQNAVPVNDWNETVMYSAVGFFNLVEIEPFIPESDTTSALTTATRILALISVGELNKETAEENPEVKALSDLQKEDGSFGGFYETVYSVMALNSCDAFFSSEKAVKNILSYQKEDGSFDIGDENPILSTSRAMTVLSMYGTDPAVADALDKTIEYIRSTETEEGLFGDGRCDTFCAAMIGLVDVGVTVTGEDWGKLANNLVKFKNDDYSYNMYTEDEQFSSTATLYAIAAFDAIGRGRSVYIRLMEDGELNQYSLKDYMPFLSGYGIIALVAVAFWVYLIFFRGRKRNEKAVKRND